MGSFGTQLRTLRNHAKLTQAELADRVGVSSTYISALESGRKSAPPRAIVSAIAAVLGLPEVEMWTLAQAEREQRLRERILGTPASRREPATALAEPADDSSAELDALISRLRQAMSDDSSRLALADALRQLAASLRTEQDSE
ncbi:MAG: helix-turn-helix transcriptional regulator [Candidatus Bipolaricaulota bacterium]